MKKVSGAVAANVHAAVIHAECHSSRGHVHDQQSEHVHAQIPGHEARQGEEPCLAAEHEARRHHGRVRQPGGVGDRVGDTCLEHLLQRDEQQEGGNRVAAADEQEPQRLGNGTMVATQREDRVPPRATFRRQ